MKTILKNNSNLKQESQFVRAFKSIYTGGFMRITKRALNSTITWFVIFLNGIMFRTIYETINRLAKTDN